MRVRVRIRGYEMFVFRKIWRDSFSCNTLFEIRPFALSWTKYQSQSKREWVDKLNCILGKMQYEVPGENLRIETFSLYTWKKYMKLLLLKRFVEIHPFKSHAIRKQNCINFQIIQNHTLIPNVTSITKEEPHKITISVVRNNSWKRLGLMINKS